VVLMAEASSTHARVEERTLFCVLVPLAGARARRVWARDGRRRTVRARGGRRSRAGTVIIGEADDIGTSNNESVEIIVIDIRPTESVVHSWEAGEVAGGWLASATFLQVNLTIGENSLSQKNRNRKFNTYTQPGKYWGWLIL